MRERNIECIGYVARAVTGGVGCIGHRRYGVAWVGVNEADISRIGVVKVICRAAPGPVMAAYAGQTRCVTDKTAMATQGSVVLSLPVRTYIPDRSKGVWRVIVAGCAARRVGGRAGAVATEAVNANSAISHTTKVHAVAQGASASNIAS